MPRPTYNPSVKKRVRALRSKGLSYNEIRRKLNLAKSTVSLWCRDVELKPEHKNRLYTKQIEILSRGPQSSRERRLREIETIRSLARKDAPMPTVSSLRIAGTMLYLAEGSKGRRSGTSITNSDERIILFMVQWLKTVFNITPNQLGGAIHYHEGDREKEIKAYWSKLTGIPLENFTKSFLKPPGTGHRKNILPHGIMRIRIRGKGSENIRHTILGWADAYLAASFLPR